MEMFLVPEAFLVELGGWIAKRAETCRGEGYILHIRSAKVGAKATIMVVCRTP